MTKKNKTYSESELSELEIKLKELEAEKDKIKQKKVVLDKARHRSIELFSEKQELKKAYNQIILQKQEIEEQKEVIVAKNERLKKAIDKAKKRTIELFGKHIDLKKASKRIEFQNELIEKKNIELEDKNREIGDSLSYAKLIQEAILPSLRVIENKFTDSFILYRPKEVVSGDFYWYSEIDNLQFFALADCTGHGVPGALMSMIGNSLLNKIINDHKNYTPSRILQLLNKEVVFTLNQSFDLDASQNDGMDITLCQIDKNSKELTIASATQNCYVISDGELNIIKGDIFSIGGLFAHHPDLAFTDYKFKISRETMVYMFSDGFQDQFGGPKDKKFMSSKLKSLLVNNSFLPMKEQKDILNHEFETWKGKNKQIDDVLVVGLKISR
jgi:serine phosphatase RsbU (regulator of sigma subunit)